MSPDVPHKPLSEMSRDELILAKATIDAKARGAKAELAEAKSRRYRGLDYLPHEEFVAMRAKGCARCQHTGYQGRIGIFEVLMMDDLIRALIARKATTSEINQAARAAGRLRTLKEDA